MQAISNTKILGNTPTIILTHKLLQSIKHLVAIAPEEAQWFHTISQDSETNSFTLDGVYIPEQVCSAAEVDSSSKMMVDFYKELAFEHGHEQASNLFSNMGAWCHSHHNMNVSPSGQDVNQFTTMINNSIEQNNLKPQIMLIFNKKNEYYNRLWDPTTDTIWENVPLILQGYDFAHLSEQAVAKFKKKTYSKTLYSTWNKKGKNKKNKTSSYFPSGGIFSQSYNSLTNNIIDSVVDTPLQDFYNEFEEMFCEIYSPNKKYINTTEINLPKVLTWYMNTLHESELNPLCFLLSENYDDLQAYLLGESYNAISTHEIVEILTEILLSKKKVLIKRITTFLCEVSTISKAEVPTFVESCRKGEF